MPEVRDTAPLSLAFILLLLACLWISWPALTGPFLFDDFPNLEHLSGLAGNLDWRSLADFARTYGGAPGRPLAMLSFVINDFSWPSSPWSFKYTNLMLHLLVGVLVFGFARSLATLRTGPGKAGIAAAFCMGAWLLQPMQLSTSMLVVQRMTQLSMLFALTGLWGYVALAKRADTLVKAIAALIALGIGTILAVLCKETGALAPLLAAVTNVTLLNPRIRDLPVRQRLLLRWGIWIPVLIVGLVIALRWNAATNFSNRDFTMAERLLSEARALCAYLYQIVVPNLRGGGIYHDDFAVSRSLFQPWTTLPSVVLVATLVIGAMVSARKWPLFAFAMLWFFAGHLLESTIFPLELYFEHRNYLPMFGPLFVLSVWATTARDRWRVPARLIAVAWVLFAALLTWVQAPIWGDIRKLTSVWAIEHPNSPRAIAQRAQYLHAHGQSEIAANTLLDAYMRGVRGGSFPVQALNTACSSRSKEVADVATPLAITELSLGRYNRATLETMGRLRKQIQAGSCPEILDEEGWLAYTVRLLTNPAYAERGAQSYIHVERAYLYRHRLDLNGTMSEFEAAWAASPSPKLAQLIAATLATAGLYDEAVKWADLALDHQLKGFQGLLSNDEQLSIRLRNSLRQAEEKQKHSKAEAARR